MHSVRRRKIITILCSLTTLGLIIGLVLYALRQNISLFYTPTELVDGHAPYQHTIRMGGMVVKGSVVRDHTLDVQFDVTDYHDTINVVYHGVLPDLFREGKGVVVQGQWDGHSRFNASIVLAKHDENYMPPEVKAILQPQQSPSANVIRQKDKV